MTLRKVGEGNKVSLEVVGGELAGKGKVLTEDQKMSQGHLRKEHPGTRNNQCEGSEVCWYVGETARQLKH